MLWFCTLGFVRITNDFSRPRMPTPALIILCQMARKQDGMSNDDWYRVLTEGEGEARPFGGIGGRMNRLRGNGPSRKNPSFCRGCFEAAPIGGAEVDVGILFADVRGFTPLTDAQGPKATAALMNRFYEMATDVLTQYDALIDKLIGDEVMALFVPGFAGPEYVENMVRAAEGLLAGVGYGGAGDPWLAIGIGLDAGIAYVGNVGTGEVKDFTALGDPVNVAARLQAQAKPGQFVMSQRVFETVPALHPEAHRLSLQLKGKEGEVLSWVVDRAD
jgi:adenylate cyclase